MRVLLAEDDPMIGASVRQGLRQDGFAVDWIEDGRAAELALAEHAHDAIVLDLGLPKRAGLDAGADDYVVKPFDLNELSARLRALLRRGAGRAAPLLAHGEVELNPATREVRLRGDPLALSPREFALLEALLARPGAILSRAQLEDKLYGWSDPVESNAVEVHIHALRKKLGADFIRNVRGVGWMVAKAPASA